MHKQIHNAEVNHECDECEKKFTNKRNLRRHKREVHFGRNVNVNYVEDLDDAEYTIQCEHCDLRFKRNFVLKRHVVSVHSASKTFQCIKCDKAFQERIY